jgi:Serine dehydrogenase proteinase
MVFKRSVNNETKRDEAVAEATPGPELNGGETAAVAREFTASILPGVAGSLPHVLGARLAELQSVVGMPLWLLLQDDVESPLTDLDEQLVHMVKHEKDILPLDQPIVCLVNSPGGSARAAFELGRMFQRRCGGYTVLVVDTAMSAATLFALGSDRIIMSEDASLGPLDAQIFDPDTESSGSVLDEVQALERLRAYGLESIDEVMILLLRGTGKKIDSLLPHVLSFVSSMMRPLMEKVDVIHYNERARILKVGEEYAIRLLRKKYPEPPPFSRIPRPDVARQIASSLVQNYPEHGFRIDREEAKSIGIHVEEPADNLAPLLESLWNDVQGVTAVGLFGERTSNEA